MKLIRELRTRYRTQIYNSGYRLSGSLDGYPLPPRKLIQLVIGSGEVAWYQLGGLFMHQTISTLLRRHQCPIERFSSILDFGCGCGRILRWWAALKDRCDIWGCDYNPVLVNWCRRNLGDIANFAVNDADPPLDFPNGAFEFLYSYSVLTHLSTERQQPWIAELTRVVARRGFLLLTVHGLRCAWRSGFSTDELRRLNEEGVVAFMEERSGSNDCAVYHSEGYMRGLGALGLELVAYVPGGVRDGSEQDLYLYRRV